MVSRKKEADEEEVPPQGPQKETPEEVVPEKQDPMQIITQLAGIIQEQQKKIEQLETNLNSIMEYLKAQSQQPQPQGGGMMEALVPLLGKLMEPAKDPLRDIALELMVESMKSNVELSKAITQRIVQGVQEKVAKQVVENVASGVITHE